MARRLSQNVVLLTLVPEKDGVTILAGFRRDEICHPAVCGARPLTFLSSLL